MKAAAMIQSAILAFSPWSRTSCEEPVVAATLPARTWEIELRVDDPPLGERGPSKTMTYEVKPSGPLTTVYVHAVSDGLDPYLRVEHASGKLIGEDDNSGGGKTGHLLLEFQSPAKVKLTVASVEPRKGGKLTLRVVESHESDATLKAAAAAGESLKVVEGLQKAGKREEARDRLRALVDAELSGGEGSRKLADSRWKAGFLGYKTGNMRLAASCWGAVREFRERTLPEDQDALRFARSNLALALAELGKYQDARVLEEKVLEVLSRTRPDDHPDLQGARRNLAQTLFRMSEFSGAATLFEKITNVCASNLPDDHPELQNARGNLALTLYELKGFKRARALHERVLEVLSRALPDDHRDLQAARLGLARTLLALGDPQGAKSLEEKVLEVYSRTLPDDHADLQRARSSLADTLNALGDPQGAKSLLKKKSWKSTRARSQTTIVTSRPQD